MNFVNLLGIGLNLLFFANVMWKWTIFLIYILRK